MTQHRDIDRGWAWVVLAASVFGQIITGMVAVSVGIFQKQFLLHFSDSSVSFISLVSSVNMSLQLTMGPVSGFLCDILGIRTVMMMGGAIFGVGLFLSSFATNVNYLMGTFSIVAGLGFGLTYTPLNVIQGHYFHKRRSVANGLTIAACGIGVGPGSSFVVWIIDSYGWRFALSVLGSIALHKVVIGCVYFPLDIPAARAGCCSRRQSEVKSTSNRAENRESCLWFLGNPQWWILCTNYGITMIGFAIHVVHFPSYALSCGVTNSELSSLMAVFGLVLSVSRIIGGFFCNDNSVDLLVVMFATQGLYGVLVLFMPYYAKSYLSLMAFQILMSLFYSASMVPLTPFAVQLFGLEKLATVFGWVMMWGGIGYLTGPVIAGIFYDVSGSYSLGFHVGGMAITGGALLLLLLPLIKVKVTDDEISDKRNALLHEDKTLTIENSL